MPEQNNATLNKDDKILLAQLHDKMNQCNDKYMITNSTFLDMRQTSLALKEFSLSDTLASMKNASIHTLFYGGYDDAERKIMLFLPSYIDDEISHFMEYPDDNPLVILRAVLKKGAPTLSHRDYLGSLMGLGIKREMTGDIIVCEDGADIIVLNEIAAFIKTHLEKAGRASLSFETLPVSQLRQPLVSKTLVKESIASLRLDNIVSAAFSLSRSKAADAIAAGIVYVDGLPVEKPEKQLSPECKLVIRGKGKVLFKSITGNSSKGRIIIELEKFN